MFSRKKFLLISKINFLVLILLLIVKVMPVTFSRYESSGVGNTNANIAFYLIELDYLTEKIKLANLSPNDKPYVFSFVVKNFNDKMSSEVSIEYNLSIVTTTNLPLSFELYENSDYTSETATNLITDVNTKVEADEDGTYFQTFSFEKEELLFKTNTENKYTLLVYFDSLQNDAVYQDAIDSIRIIVDSRQIIDS